MRCATVCSGIGTPEIAFRELGWTSAYCAETDPHASAVLAHRFPDAPNLGDFTQIDGGQYGHLDLLCAGTPCQDFSVAGKRAGFIGDRGGLTGEFVRLLARERPTWIVWENVEGVLHRGHRAGFFSFLGQLHQLGYCLAWRLYDTRYTRVARFPRGVPQRRRRVYVVGRIGDWRGPVAVQFDPAGHPGMPAQDAEIPRTDHAAPGGVPRTPRRVLARDSLQRNAKTCVDHSPATVSIAYNWAKPIVGEHCPTIGAHHASKFAVIDPGGPVVRRLTPREHERLQGLPDDWTNVPGVSMGQRYRLVGNGMSLNVLLRIYEGIQAVTDWEKGGTP